MTPCVRGRYLARVAKSVQIRGIPDETYRKLTQRAAEARVSVPDYLRCLAERGVSRPSIAEWVERTRVRGGPERTSDVIEALDDLRGVWLDDAGR